MLIGIRWRCSAADTVLGNSCPYMAGERSPNLPIYLVMNILNAGLDVRTWVPTAQSPVANSRALVRVRMYEYTKLNHHRFAFTSLSHVPRSEDSPE